MLCVLNPRTPPRLAGMLAEMSKLKQQVAGLEETVRSLHEQLEVQSRSAAPRMLTGRPAGALHRLGGRGKTSGSGDKHELSDRVSC